MTHALPHSPNKFAVTAERIIAEYAKIAFASLDDYIRVDPDGAVHIDLSKTDRAQRDGLTEITVTEHSGRQDGSGATRRVKIKLGKLQALAALGRHLGVFEARAEPEAETEAVEQETELLERMLAAQTRAVDHERAQRDRLERELRETREALAAATAATPSAAPAVRPDRHRADTPTAPPPQTAPLDEYAGTWKPRPPGESLGSAGVPPGRFR